MKFSRNFAVNSPLKNKRRFVISHEQNNSFCLNLTSYKHRQWYYGHHSNFRTANFYIKIFWKRTWPPTVEEFHMISRMKFSHEQNNLFRLNLTSYKHRHRYYGHHSYFRTANFYIKIFWKRTWPPTVEEFRMISCMTWLACHSKLQPIKSHHFFGTGSGYGKV